MKIVPHHALSRRILHPRTPAAPGFTLIELLVVVAIIVLLIAILLPVVDKAQRMADQARCGSNQRQIAMAVLVYAVDHKDHMPGPNTSGLVWLQSPTPLDNFALSSPSTPVSPDDWVSPVFGDRWGIRRSDRGLKIKAVMNRDELHCPANEFRYEARTGPVYFSINSTIGTIRYASYSMPYTFHAYPSAAETPATGGFPLSGRDLSAVDLGPARHRFRLDTLGNPSMKVLLADGSNWIRYTTNQLILDTNYNSMPDGRAFMSRGATLNVVSFASAINPYRQGSSFLAKSIHPLAEEITYRHEKTINAVFWDGHVENMSVERSRDAELWFPSGSVARSSFYIADEDIRIGDIIR